MTNSYRSRIERGPMAGDRFTQLSNALFRDRRISHKAKGVFGLISTHRDGYGLTIAGILRDSKEGRDAIRGALEELEKFGYLVREQQHDDDGKFTGVVYRITDMPAHLYELFGDDAPQLPTKAAADGAFDSAPMSGFPTTDEPMTEDPHSKNTNHQKIKNQEDQGQAPTARSAGDARRATAGSSAREPRGGSAATSKTARPKKTPKLTRAQVAAVAQVEAALPRTLVERLPYQQLPTSVRRLVAGELEHRTVEQLISRAARRWEFHGYAKGSFSAEGPNLRRAVGVANALLRAGECPDPGCEDGRIIDTGVECKACPERRARRRAGSAPVPGQRSKAPAWICRSCWAPGKGEAPADLDCRRCRTEAADTCAALEASWKAEMAPAPAEPSAAPQEPAEAPRRPDTAETAPAETDEERAEREEMDRLRAEIAAANPGLAAIAQKANH
jgi:hypothetical protein